MSPWKSVFDEACEIIRNGLLPFLQRALDESDAEGVTGWQRVQDRQRQDGVKADRLSRREDSARWSTDYCLQLMGRRFSEFEHCFQDGLIDEHDLKKATKMREGWINHLLLLRNKKAHVNGIPFYDDEGEHFLFVASALLKAIGADGQAEHINSLRKILRVSIDPDIVSHSIEIQIRRSDGTFLGFPVPVSSELAFYGFLDKIYWAANMHGEFLDEFTYGKTWILKGQDGLPLNKIGDLDRRRLCDMGLKTGMRLLLTRLPAN